MLAMRSVKVLETAQDKGPGYREWSSDMCVRQTWVTSLWPAEGGLGGKRARLAVLQEDCIGNGRLSLYQENGNLRNVLERQTMKCSGLDSQGWERRMGQETGNTQVKKNHSN